MLKPEVSKFFSKQKYLAVTIWALVALNESKKLKGRTEKNGQNIFYGSII